MSEVVCERLASRSIKARFKLAVDRVRAELELAREANKPSSSPINIDSMARRAYRARIYNFFNFLIII